MFLLFFSFIFAECYFPNDPEFSSQFTINNTVLGRNLKSGINILPVWEEGIFGECSSLKQVSFLSKNSKFETNATLFLNNYQTEFYVVNQKMKNKLISDQISSERIIIISNQQTTGEFISPRLYTSYILISLFCK